MWEAHVHTIYDFTYLHKGLRTFCFFTFQKRTLKCQMLKIEFALK